ncbi:MAG: hypothetical protein KF889_29280 [Alphaproteobacteria bacterium]|nr:hypothetical protein [Alphaproteobacteria bacterium]MCW5742487.1 hypothetical protein [Alphaproteobacteria bacterium]
MTLNNAKDIHLVLHAVHKQRRLHGGAGEFLWSTEARSEGEFAACRLPGLGDDARLHPS